MPPACESPLIAALDRRWQEYRLRFKSCRRQLSESAVHDLRVGTRRLLATQDILRSLDPHPRIKKTRRALKRLLSDLDGLRDLQVMLIRVKESPEHQPALGTFLAQLEKREKRLLRRTGKALEASRPSVLRTWIAKTRAKTATGSQHEHFSERVLGAVDGLYRNAANLSDEIEPTQPTTLHRARIAFKRFRYAAEIVEPVLPSLPAGHFKRMHDHQSMMGDIRDLEIFREALREFAERAHPGHSSDTAVLELEAIAREYEERQRQMVAAFLTKRDELRTFWRVAPDQPFPWEGAFQ